MSDRFVHQEFFMFIKWISQKTDYVIASGIVAKWSAK